MQIIQKWPPIWIPLDYFGAKRWRDKKNTPKIQTGQYIAADQRPKKLETVTNLFPFGMDDA